MDLSRFATQRFARTRFDLTANNSSFSLDIVSFMIAIIKIICVIFHLDYQNETHSRSVISKIMTKKFSQTDQVKPDGSDDDKVGNNTEHSEAHVQDDHQPALMMVTTLFNKTTSLTRLITIIMIFLALIDALAAWVRESDNDLMIINGRSRLH